MGAPGRSIGKGIEGRSYDTQAKRRMLELAGGPEWRLGVTESKD